MHHHPHPRSAMSVEAPRRRTHAPPGQSLLRRLIRPRVSLPTAFVAVATVAATVFAVSPNANAALAFEVNSLDGSGNNLAHPTWGKVGQNYLRVGPTLYADGRGQQVNGPNVRFVSNRIFNDLGQNVFSEHRVTQWGWTWGQFIDHNIGLRDESGTEVANIPFSSTDPLEQFTNTLGVVPFTRTKAAAGTGVTNPRQQMNTVSSYIDGWAVYGGTNDRLEWLREGAIDGNVTNNGARLLMPGNMLPRRDSRGNPSAAPNMAIDGRLAANPNAAFVAGDVRGNENIALTATHTLFAREHNRIVSLLPNTLTNEEKFQVARRIVSAEIQYVTYNEFLPSMGVNLSSYTGYKPNVDATLSNEFAVAGYRAHSPIHGEFEVDVEKDVYTPAELDALKAAGVTVTDKGDELSLGVSLNIAFFNPDLLGKLKVGPFLKAIGGESEYNNDEQMDNHLRSVLFQVPNSSNPDCLDDPTVAQCFKGVVDLAAIDIQRGRDHGVPLYNDMRRAYGLPPKTSFRDITGETSEAFPPGTDINTPAGLDYTNLQDLEGTAVTPGDPAGTAVKSVRKTPLAARLKAIYGTVDKIDSFVGLTAEKHLPGSEFGELQQAIWAKQFMALRDGDRFFYGNDPALKLIKDNYGVDFHSSLAQIIASNTDQPVSTMNDNVFLTPDANLPTPACTVSYHVDSTWGGMFQTSLSIKNLSATPTSGWTVQWQFPTGQSVHQLWNGNASQSGSTLTVRNASWNAVIPGNGGVLADVGFIGGWDNTTNASPPNITFNGRRCARG